MSTPYEVPLSPQAQAFTISIADVSYRFTVRWCAFAAAWLLDISDVNAEPMVQSLPLVCGTDLLEQYQHLEFGFQLFAQTDFASSTPPTFENLGVTGRLYAVIP